MTYKLDTILKIHTGWINSIDLDPQQAFIASTATDNSVKITDIDSKKLLFTINQETPCRDLKFSNLHPYLYLASSDKLVKCYDLVDRTFIKEFYGHESAITALAVDGNRIISGSGDGCIRIWDIRTKQSTNQLFGHTAAVNAIKLLGDELFSCSMDGTVRRWDNRYNNTISARHKSNVFDIIIQNKDIISVSNNSLMMNRIDIPATVIETGISSTTHKTGGLQYSNPSVLGPAVEGQEVEVCHSKAKVSQGKPEGTGGLTEPRESHNGIDGALLTAKLQNIKDESLQREEGYRSLCTLDDETFLVGGGGFIKIRQLNSNDDSTVIKVPGSINTIQRSISRNWIICAGSNGSIQFIVPQSNN